LTEEAPSTKRRLQIRALDTVFLFPPHKGTSNTPQLHSWLYTSKKCHFVQRKLGVNGKQNSGQDTSGQKLSLQHVYERFCRIALSHPGNACKTVAVAHQSDGSRSHISADGLKRAAQGRADNVSGDILRNECALQCFIQPSNGKDIQYRAIFKYSPAVDQASPGNELGSSNFKVDLYLLENVMSVPSIRIVDGDEDVGVLSKDLQSELINSTISMAKHIEEILEHYRGESSAELRASKRVILVLVSDFVLDDKRQLWLCHVPKVTSINSSNIPECKEKIADVVRIEVELSSEEFLRDVSEGSKTSITPSYEQTPGPKSPSQSTCSALKHKRKGLERGEKVLKNSNDERSLCGRIYVNHDDKMRGLSSVYSCQNHTKSFSDSKSRELKPAKQSNYFPSINTDKTCKKEVRDRSSSHVLDLVKVEGEGQESLPLKPGRNTDELIQSLRKRVAALEREVQVTISKAKQSADAAMESSANARKLSQKLAKVERDYRATTQDLRDEHKQALLALNAQFSESKAEIARLNAIPKQWQQRHNEEGGPSSGDDQSSSFHVRQDLLVKIDELHDALASSRRLWGEEKRSLSSSHAAKEQSLAAAHRMELSKQRTSIVVLEDSISNHQESLRSVEKENIVLTQRLADADQTQKQLKEKVEQLIKEKDVLRKEQRSVSQGSNNNESSSERADEAKIRSLNNKVEYLKAQLISEATLKDDYVDAIEKLRLEKEKLASSARSNLRQLEVSKEKEILKLQEQMREAISGPLQEVSKLRSKLKSLQSQLNEAEENAKVSKAREDEATDNVSKERAKIRILYEDLANIRGEAEAARDELKFLKESDNSSATEAMIRRLDNERKYLKSQLENEVTSKGDLEEKLEKAIRDVQQIQCAWSSDSDALKLQLREAEDNHESVMAEKCSKNQALEAEVRLLNNQLDELKQAYIKTRDQMRLDQAAAEQMRSASKRFVEELRAAQDELTEVKGMSEETIARHKANTRAISLSMKKAEDIHAGEISRLQEEIRNAFSSVGQNQRAMADMQEQMRVQRKEGMQTQATNTLVCTFVTFQQRQKAKALSIWISCTYVLRGRDRQLENMERTIADAKERIKVEQEGLYRSAIGKLQLDHEAYVRELEALKREERQRLEESAKANVKRAVEEGNRRLVSILDERRAAWEAKERGLNEKHISMMERQAGANKKHIESMNAGFQREMKMKLAEAEQGFHERQEITLKDFDKRMSEALSDTEARLRSEKESALQRQSCSHNEIVDKERSLFLEEKHQLEVDWKQKLDATINQERRRYENSLTAALKDATRKAQTMTENRLDEMRRDCETEKLHIIANHERELKKMSVANEETLLKIQSAAEREETLHAQLKIAHDRETQQREEIIKIETEKWQKVLIHVEEQSKVKCQQAHDDGFRKRDEQAATEIASFESSTNQTIEKMKKSAQQALEEALEESARKIQEAEAHSEKKKKVAYDKALADAEASYQALLLEKEKANIAVIELCKEECIKSHAEDRKRAVAEAVDIERGVANRLQIDLKSCKNEWMKVRQELEKQLESVSEKATDTLRRTVEEADARALEADRKFSQELQDGLASQKAALHEQYEQHRKDDNLMHLKKTEKAVNEIQKTAEIEMERAMSSIESDHRQKVHALEEKISSCQEENSEIEMKLIKAKNELENRAETIRSTTASFEMTRKESSFTHLRLVTTMLQNRDLHSKQMEEQKAQYKGELARQKHDSTIEERRLESLNSTLEEKLRVHKRQRKRMQDILTNHKRDFIVSQQSQCREVSVELDEALRKREAVQEQQKKFEAGMESMQSKLHDLEKQIQNHSQTSAIQDGRVNLAHARKKRRLDEEFEQLVDDIEAKREQISVLDLSLKRLTGKKEEIENRMKTLERGLVEVLVEQQKKLFSILSLS